MRIVLALARKVPGIMPVNAPALVEQPGIVWVIDAAATEERRIR